MSATGKPAVWHYFWALLSVAAAVGLRRLLDPWLGEEYAYATVFFAILFAAWQGGFKPALAAVIMGTLACDYFLLPPRGGFKVHGPEMLGLGLFVVRGLGVAVLGGLMHRAGRRAEAQAVALRDSNEHLEARVAERTAELQQKTETLEAEIAARRQAEEAAARLAAIVQSSDDAIIGKDHDGIITSWNAGAERIFGYAAEAMVGQSIRRLIPPELQHEEDEILAQVRRGESIRHYETVRQCQDGRRLDISVTISPIKDEAGKIMGISKIASDISDRKRAEMAARASQARLDRTLEAARIGYWELDLVKRKANRSRQHARIFGYLEPSSEWNFDKFLEHVLPDEREQVKRTFLAAVAAKTDWDIECRIRRCDGACRWIWAHGYAVLDAGGTLVELAGMVSDITERKAAEAALRESQRFLHSALNALSPHIAILDAEGSIVEVNAAWNRYARENNYAGGGLGNNYLRICHSATGHASDEAETVAGGIRAVIAGKMAEFHLEYPCHSPQERRWFVVRVTRFAGDGPVRVVVAHEDITERKLAEAEIQKQLRELERWHEVMLNREGRVLELKREVNELLGRQQQPPRYTANA